jgi:hypothetical protein
MEAISDTANSAGVEQISNCKNDAIDKINCQESNLKELNGDDVSNTEHDHQNGESQNGETVSHEAIITNGHNGHSDHGKQEHENFDSLNEKVKREEEQEEIQNNNDEQEQEKLKEKFAQINLSSKEVAIKDEEDEQNDENTEAINRNKLEIESPTSIPHSQSIEFTYTTFDSVKEDYADEMPNKSIEQSTSNGDLKSNNDQPQPQQSQNTNQYSENNIIKSPEAEVKNVEFDQFIGLVKLNKITNKEVCNYMLNLLVSGEFDLEKNFVIQNVKSILSLIQVIKCAQPSLKVSN